MIARCSDEEPAKWPEYDETRCFYVSVADSGNKSVVDQGHPTVDGEASGWISRLYATVMSGDEARRFF